MDLPFHVYQTRLEANVPHDNSREQMCSIPGGGQPVMANPRIRRTFRTFALPLLMLLLSAHDSVSQSVSDLERFFREDVGLSADQIANIQAGKPVVKALPARTPAEVILFGATYIHAAPESYVKFHNDFERLRALPNYLALGVFSDPPRLSDLNGFAFDSEEIESLKDCRPGDCLIQLPASSIEQVQQSIDQDKVQCGAQNGDCQRGVGRAQGVGPLGGENQQRNRSNCTAGK